MAAVKRLANVGLHVADIERSLAIYRDVLGLEVHIDSGWKREPALLAISGTPGAAIRIVNLVTPDPGATSSITLVQLDEIDRTAVRGRFQDPGTVHIAFEVDELEPVCRDLVGAGCATLAPPAVLTGGAPGTARIVFAVDPDGVFVELVERIT